MRHVALVLALLAPLAASGSGCDKLKQTRAQRESAESDSEEPSPKKKKKKKPAEAAPSSPRLAFETLSATPVAPTGGKLVFTPEQGQGDDGAPKISAEADFTKDAAKKILPILRKAKSGALPAVEIHVMPQFVLVRLHEETDKVLLHELLLQGDTFSDKGMIKPTIERQARQLAEQVFEASSVDFEGLPKIAADAVRRVPNGKLAKQIAIRRFLPWDRNVQIRVFVEDAAGESKFVDYDARGAFKKSG